MRVRFKQMLIFFFRTLLSIQTCTSNQHWLVLSWGWLLCSEKTS